MAGVGTLLGKAAGGASLLASVQLVSRAVTFVMNVMLARAAKDTSAMGLAAVQLYLLNTATLSLAREGARRTGMRVAGDKNATRNNKIQRDLINLTWWIVLAGTAITPIVCYYFAVYIDPIALGGVSLSDYEYSVNLVGFSVVVELLSEPMFIAAQGQMAYAARSVIEAAAIVARCLVQVAGVLIFGLDLSAFAYGYIAYSFGLLIGYSLYFHRKTSTRKDDDQHLFTIKSVNDLLPSQWLLVEDADLKALFLGLNVQQVWKLALQEGEKIIMMAFRMPASEQAVYSLVFNLGSLVVRFVFYPIEESTFTVFGKLNDLAMKKDGSFASSSPDNETEVTLSRLVIVLTKLMTLIGLVFITFAPSYSHLLLLLLYGPRWAKDTNAPTVLGLYCVYVGVIAVNGVTEAFVQSVGSQAQIRGFNRWLLFFSCINLVGAAALFSFGSSGLIAANCVTMLCRIAYNISFISSWEDPSENGHRFGSAAKLFPSLSTWVAFSLCMGLVIVSERQIYNDFSSVKSAAAHVVVGGCAFVLLSAVVVFRFERSFIRQIRSIMSFVRLSKGSPKED